MITFYDRNGVRDVAFADLEGKPLPDGVMWIDLVSETEAETAFVERTTGLRLPSRHRRAEIEDSSRLSMDDDVLTLSTPVLYRENGTVRTTPVGFVLSPHLLVTLRSENLKSFAEFVAHREGPDCRHPKSGIDVLTGLLNAIVGRMADGMEAVGADLEAVSRVIFATHVPGEPRKKPSRIEADLHSTLQIIGRSGDTTGHARDSLLGLRRLIAFVAGNTDARSSPEAKRDLKSLRQDIDSLEDYETRLTDKVQFLLDSTLGFINIEQNRTFKLLTVASVIGIPPTFVVGLYGMNFKSMPEYDWTYGYAWGLFLVLLSIVVPVVWLRNRGWF